MCSRRRSVHPTLLKAHDRGKFHNPLARPMEYGAAKVLDRVEGIELLEAYERGEIVINSDGECPTNS